MKTLAKSALFGCCLSLLSMSGAYAAGEPKCMKCHKDGDFAGKSVDEIVAAARDVEKQKKHKVNSSLSDEQLRAFVEELVKSGG